MIAALTGAVQMIGEDAAVIDVAGVGYEVHAAPRTLAKLVVGEPASLSIETIVREDMIRLIGFETMQERQSFRLLQSVQGVGAKHALALLNIMAPNALYDAIVHEDATAIERAPGVGKKLAQRIITELREKAGGFIAGSGLAPSVSDTPAPSDVGAAGAPQGEAIGDAVSALVSLGYEAAQARRAVAQAKAGGAEDVQALIRVALQTLAAA